MKILTNLALILLIPMFLSSMMLSYIGMDYYFGGVEGVTLLTKILSGNVNNGFVCILFGLGNIGTIICIVLLMYFVRYIDKMNKLDTMADAYHREKKNLNITRNQLTEEIEKYKNGKL